MEIYLVSFLLIAIRALIFPLKISKFKIEYPATYKLNFLIYFFV